jgi:uncharacterized RDD family membrane protein YckC
MQHTGTREQVEYASVGWRVAAVLVDTAVLLGLLFLAMVVWLLVLVAQGRLDPNDPAAVQEMAQEIGTTSDWVVNAAFFGALFIYYVLLEGIFGASIGKLVFRMRVVMIDGSRPTGVAIVLRNLIRIPEAWLLYIPAGVSSLASSRRQRLGDHAARTVVVRRAALGGAATSVPPQMPPFGRPPQSPPGSPQQPGAPQAPPAWGPPATGSQGDAPGYDASGWTGEPAGHVSPAPPAGDWPAAPGAWTATEATPVPTLDGALAGLKQAALAARGAHLNYLYFSERELDTEKEGQAETYSGEYVGAWFTLADAVTRLRQTHAAATEAAAAAGQTLAEACAPQPDLPHLLRGLAPYVAAQSDEQVHEAFLIVAREEAQTS